jgi:hypothetical protein
MAARSCEGGREQENAATAETAATEATAKKSNTVTENLPNLPTDIFLTINN